jgi:hypothetical protein
MVGSIPLKKMILFLLLVCSQFIVVLGQTSSGVVAEGSCYDTIRVTSIPSYPLNAYDVQYLYLCGIGNNCCAWTFSGPMTPRYYLSKLNPITGNFEHFTGPQQSSIFTGLGAEVGTYRVNAHIPKYLAYENCEDGFMHVFDLAYRWLGYGGFYEQILSNEVIVGNPTGADNNFKFVDGNGILLFGSDPGLPIFDEYEEWKIDVSDSKNYNQWYLAMYKLDPPVNLPWHVWGNGWHLDGPPANPEFGLGHWWRVSVNEIFEPGETYVVQWVATNKDCASWNINAKEAYICPSGWPCRIGIPGELDSEEIVLYPNPMSTEFMLSDNSRVERLEMVDINGRIQGTWQGASGRYEVPMVSSGIYYVRFFDEKNMLLNTVGVQVIR